MNMQYVDFANPPALEIESKRKKRKKIIIFTSGLILASLVLFVGYAFYWPISNILSQIIKNPGIVLSFFREPSGKLKSTDGKTNFLLLGIDKRTSVPYTFSGPSGKQEHNGFLSDTIIVASVDLNSKEISLISIPRDTWVSIPGWENFSASQAKINSAYSLGDMYSYPGGGLKLASRVVSEHLGIPIHYATRVDFESFKKAIDTLGGIDVKVDTTFDDYRYPLEGKEKTVCTDGTYNCRFEHIHFDAGRTHMDGSTALKFVRSRTGTNGEGSDFARARRQQKVIQAALKKALSVGNLLDPFKLNSLFRDFGQAVETDFDLVSIPQVIKLSKEVNTDSFETFVLDPSSGLMYNPSPSLYGGAYVIIPKNGWNEVKSAVRKFLTKASGNQ